MKKLKYVFFLILILAFFPISGISNVIFVASIGSLLIMIKSVIQKQIDYNVFFNWYTFFMFGWIIISGVTLIWVKDYYWWAIYTGTLLIVFINSLMLSYLIKDKLFLKQLFNLFFLISLVHKFISWFEIYSGKYLFTTNYNNIEYSRNLNRPLSFFYNTNDLATFLLFSAIIFLFWESEKLNKATNISLRLLLSISNIILIYQTGSRTILATSIIVYLLYIYLNVSNKFVRLMITNGIIFSVIGAIGGILYVVFSGGIVISDSSLAVRLNLIKNSIIHLLQSYSFGVGSGNGFYYMENFNYFSTYGVSHLHNWWLEILVMYGVVFFMVYLVYYFRAIYRAYINIFNNLNAHKRMYIAIFIILVSFIFSLMTSSSNFTKLWIWFVYNVCFIIVEVLPSRIISQRTL